MNQNPKQLARHRIDDQLNACSWRIQDKKSPNLASCVSGGMWEYQTNAIPTHYILFVNRQPVRLIEAKRKEGVRLNTVEDKSTEYANTKLKYIKGDPLRFVYESRGKVISLPITATPSVVHDRYSFFIPTKLLRVG